MGLSVHRDREVVLNRVGLATKIGLIYYGNDQESEPKTQQLHIFDDHLLTP